MIVANSLPWQPFSYLAESSLRGLDLVYGDAEVTDHVVTACRQRRQTLGLRGALRLCQSHVLVTY